MASQIEERTIRTPPGAGWEVVGADGYRLHVDLDEVGLPSLEESVKRTLTDDPPWLHCRWLYDDIGSQLYERITDQPEYYLTRVEDGILAEHAEELSSLLGESTIVELGSGSSIKTRHLLAAWRAQGETRYVPVDISRSAIARACSELARAYPGLLIEGLAARYARALPLIGDFSPLVLLFLGSTIGNFNDPELDGFLQLVAAALNPGDHFLLGVDLVKDPRVLDAAYNDAAGWTERFMVNLMARLNRELGAGIPLDAVVYEGAYNEELERVEMFLRFTRQVGIRLPNSGDSVCLPAGERVMIEISRKFRVDRLVAKVGEFGFKLQRCFSDPDEFFAVLLLTRED